MNSCNMTGRLTKDVDISFSQSGTAIGKFSIAVQRDMKDKTTGKYESDFINCLAWGKTAEFAANYSSKGKLVEICGRWETGSYQKKDGSKVYTNTLIVEKFKPLEWGDTQSENFTPADTDDDIPF